MTEGIQAKSKTLTVADVSSQGSISVSIGANNSYWFAYSYRLVDGDGAPIPRMREQNLRYSCGAASLPVEVAAAIQTLQAYLYKQALQAEGMIDESVKE